MASFVDYKAKNGVTYVYENISKWCKETKKCITARKCIGKRDPITNEIIFNDFKAVDTKIEKSVDKPVVLSIGTTLLLDKASVETGLRDTLKQCFPDKWSKILTMAYYFALENKAVSHCEAWSSSTRTPFGSRISGQRVSELCEELTVAEQMRFFKDWIKHNNESAYHALDITSVSSYSELNEMVRYGYNRDKEKLPQINVCMLMGNNTRIPIYYEVLPGSICDVSTLKKIVADLKWLNAGKLSLVMDKGFCSEDNIDNMYANGLKFILGMSFSNSFTKDCVNFVRNGIDSFENYVNILGDDLFAKSFHTSWKGHRCYCHVYYDSEKADGEYRALLRHIEKLRCELESGKTIDSHKADYMKYFNVHETPVKGRKVEIIQTAIDEFKNGTAGYFVLISNNVKDPKFALEVYRNKDCIEKGFDNLKDSLDFKRLRTHGSKTMQGRIFLQFVSLILISYIQNVMREQSLYKNHTVPSIMNELKTLNEIKYPGKRKLVFTELTKNQKKIFEAFRIPWKTYV